MAQKEKQRVYSGTTGSARASKEIELDLGEGRERVLHVAYFYYLYIFTCTDDETKMIPQ